MAEYKGPLDYIDVAARIVEFRTKHPEGNLEQRDLRFIDFAGKSWVVYTAAAMRHPEENAGRAHRHRNGVGTRTGTDPVHPRLGVAERRDRRVGQGHRRIIGR